MPWNLLQNLKGKTIHLRVKTQESYSFLLTFLNRVIFYVFLAVQNSSLGDLVTESLTDSTFTFEVQRATLETCDL